MDYLDGFIRYSRSFSFVFKSSSSFVVKQGMCWKKLIPQFGQSQTLHCKYIHSKNYWFYTCPNSLLGLLYLVNCLTHMIIWDHTFIRATRVHRISPKQMKPPKALRWIFRYLGYNNPNYMIATFLLPNHGLNIPTGMSFLQYQC